MKVIYNNYIPFDGFVAINICGIVFSRKKQLNDITLNHEEIHTIQMKELWYVGFYLWYLIEWLINLVKFGDSNKAYRNISFEQEAYTFEKDAEYLRHRKSYKWLDFLF